MAHPQLHRQADRRVFLAAGTAAALLLAPAAQALPLNATLDCSPTAVAADTLLRQQCEDADLLPAAVETAPQAVPEAVRSAVDPIEEVVGEVLDRTPPAVAEAVEQAPAVVDDAVEAVPAPDVPVEPPPVPDVVPDSSAPGDDVGAADSSVAPVRPSAPQGPGFTLPPFVWRGVPPAVTTTAPRRVQPLAPPVMSAPFFGDLAQVAEDFVSSRSPVSNSLEAFAGGGTSTVPGPDASSWLLATATGMLLLVGASHLVHARQRYVASVAR